MKTEIIHDGRVAVKLTTEIIGDEFRMTVTVISPDLKINHCGNLIASLPPIETQIKELEK